VPFAFDQLDNPQAGGFLGDARPLGLAAAAHGAWVAFATHGDANHAALPEWPRDNFHMRPTMIVDVRCHVDEDPSADDIVLWDGVL